MNFPGRKPTKSLDWRNPTPKISFYWPMHFYLINKKTSMDQLKKHGPYIGPCYLFQGWIDKRKKTYKR